MDVYEQIDIVIAGAGICGLATALALHRKGIRSVVLERSETLRATGAAIFIMANGWRVLDQLGVGSKLRQTALPIEGSRLVLLDEGKQQELPFGNGETRCLKRSDLIEILAESLPHGTVRFGCQIVSVKLDHSTSYPILQLQDGSSIMAKVLIGCDGAKSVVADFLELKPSNLHTICATRGLTTYANGHPFANEFVKMKIGDTFVGRIPITDELVFWFVVQQWTSKDAKVSQDSKLIQQSALESTMSFPIEITEMIKSSDPSTLSLTRMRYRSPWNLLLAKFRKGTVTLAGDAMHVMGPFLGQGGSAGLEDAIALARCLAEKMSPTNPSARERKMMVHEIGEAMDQYVKERRMRVVQLSTQTYLCGLLWETPTTSLLVKFACFVFLAIFFRNPTYHTKYDCGRL
ncbi:monooxygenase 1-like [Cornus florida]|uniref:monooxygenase 1-like n=1 Tax=Cornus florida TaxID=4283 RepID=UPI0028A0B633|nr:monooxygenase 1-like [Cornus florida]